MTGSRDEKLPKEKLVNPPNAKGHNGISRGLPARGAMPRVCIAPHRRSPNLGQGGIEWMVMALDSSLIQIRKRHTSVHIEVPVGARVDA